MAKEKSLRWHPNQESDQLIFAVCDRFLTQQRWTRDDSTTEEGRGAAAVAKWLNEEWGRKDLTREKVYPLFWEAVHRNFLILQPPLVKVMTDRLTEKFALEQYHGQIQVANITGPPAAGYVAELAVDRVLALIEEVAKVKREQAIQQNKDPKDISVHLGMGAGYAAMLVAKKLALQIASGHACPKLVLHAISSGGFFIEQPHKAPITYFGYFDEVMTKVEFVALFSETVVKNKDYEATINGPSLKHCFDRKSEIDIVITSLAASQDRHGLLGQYLSYLVREKRIDDINEKDLQKMNNAGWIGDVQFRPYSARGPLDEAACPVRAVALFELDELVQFAQKPDKYVVLVAGPCGECHRAKTDALRPLLENPRLRLWTDLVTDIQTASELLDDCSALEQNQK